MPNDIRALMSDNDTFAECPKCHKTKKLEPIPGLLHVYIVCLNCETIRVQRFGRIDLQTSGV